LIDFGNRISASNAEVIIFMARKAACLFHCLEDLKLAYTNAICTSDLALDGDLSWIRGKSVLLVDDTVITGTTLYKARKRLLDAGAASLKTIVICVDNENWCQEIVNPEQPYITAKPHEVTSFSAQSVRAIGVIPRPYLIDFPLYNFIRLKGLSLDPVLSLTGWKLDELTTDSQRLAGATSITMTPSKRALLALDQNLGWNCSKFSQLLKIRLYSRIRGGRNRTSVHFCRALPIVAFDPTTKVQIDEIWKIFDRNLGSHAHALGTLLCSGREKLRLLQYFCASKLFETWLSDVRDACAPRVVSFELDFRQIDFGFPPDARDGVIELLRTSVKCPLGGAPNVRAVKLSNHIDLGIKTRFKGDDLLGIQAKLTEPLAALYSQREIALRKMIKENGVEAFDLAEYNNLIDRLNQGISLPELIDCLSYLENNNLAGHLVSMFMDDAVDRGIAVPITVDDGTLVYRAFRHGEDVKFTEIEARLTCLMLEEFGKALDLQILPRLVVEKLIVLLIKGGLSRGFIDRWTGSLADRKAAGIRFYLQGAVAQLNPDRRPYHYDPGDSLTKLMLGWGFLQEEKRGGQYKVVSFPDRPPTTNKMEKDAKALGLTIAQALSNITPTQRDDELTLIATCLNPIDAAASLAAEIHYFESHWETLSGILFADKINQNAEAILRRNEIYEAVNSGLWKWRKHHEGKTIKLLEEWYSRLSHSTSSILYDAVLEGAFPMPDESYCSEELSQLIDQIGRWLLDVNIALRQLRVILLSSPQSREASKSSTITKDLLSQIKEMGKEAKYESPEIELQDSQLSLLYDEDLKAALSPILITLNKLAITARMLLDKVDAIVTPFGKPRNLNHYRHLLTIKISNCDDNRELLIAEIDNKIRKLVIDSANSTSSANLFALSNPIELFDAEFAICATGLFARDWLSQISEAVFSVKGNHFYRMCIWADLEPDEQIVRGENSSEALARNLIERIHSLNSIAEFTKHSRNEVIVLSSYRETVLSSVRNELSNHMGDSIRPVVSKEVTLTKPRDRVYAMEIYEKLTPEQIKHPKADVGIITIVQEEMNAVISMLKKANNYCKLRIDGSVFYRAEMLAEDSKSHFVVATQQMEQGNRSVIMAYERLCSQFNPSVVVLLGIGGAIAKEVELCDVVVADKVIWYEQATVTNAGTNHKGESTKLSPWIRVLLNDFFAEKGYPYSLCKNDQDNANSKVFLGPVGSGEKVVRYRDAAVRKWLMSFDYKCMALETEAGGLAQAFYETGISSRYLAKGYMVIRGISDHADKDKNDAYRTLSARNACDFLADFLAHIPPVTDYLSYEERESGNA